MKYYLDGYNVIGYCDHIQLSNPNKVELLVAWLQKHQKKGVQLVLIFDGKNEFMASPTKQHLPGLTIIHTAADRSADDYIKEVILTKRDKSNKVIVTSDRDILYHAKKAQFKVMSSDAFLNFISQVVTHEPQKRSPKITDRHVDYWLNEFNQSDQ